MVVCSAAVRPYDSTIAKHRCCHGVGIGGRVGAFVLGIEKESAIGSAQVSAAHEVRPVTAFDVVYAIDFDATPLDGMRCQLARCARHRCPHCSAIACAIL